MPAFKLNRWNASTDCLVSIMPSEMSEKVYTALYNLVTWRHEQSSNFTYSEMSLCDHLRIKTASEIRPPHN